MTYREAIEFLYELRWFGAKFGLENTRKLARLAGNPQENLRFIHVAGTNGKGSTCAMLESVYRNAGMRVGLFTSPHLVSFSERIQVNREPISEADVIFAVEQMKVLLREFERDHHPTFFEVVVVMALRYFANCRCDLVIWETGLGGRLDATNIVTPLASVITNIQFDHEKWLGCTLGSIAKEKAGIIKPGVPVISGVIEAEPRGVIVSTAQGSNAPLIEVSADDANEMRGTPLPLLGDHQLRNAALAVKTVRALQETLPVSSAQLRTGLESVNWPGRLQLAVTGDGRRMLLDAAHNPAGAATLSSAIQAHFKSVPISMVLGILLDKDWSQMCEILAPLAVQIFLVPVHSERTADPRALASACHQANPEAQIIECDSLETALATPSSGELLVIAGSLYLIGEAMELLDISRGMKEGERLLNEWNAKPSLEQTDRSEK